jgi:hypothetical protein
MSRTRSQKHLFLAYTDDDRERVTGKRHRRNLDKFQHARTIAIDDES